VDIYLKNHNYLKLIDGIIQSKNGKIVTNDSITRLGEITGGLGGSVLNEIKNQRGFNDSNEYTLLGKDA